MPSWTMLAIIWRQSNLSSAALMICVALTLSSQHVDKLSRNFSLWRPLAPLPSTLPVSTKCSSRLCFLITWTMKPNCRWRIVFNSVHCRLCASGQKNCSNDKNNRTVTMMMIPSLSFNLLSLSVHRSAVRICCSGFLHTASIPGVTSTTITFTSYHNTSVTTMYIQYILGRRDFAVSGPATWNSLPVELRTSTLSMETFVKNSKVISWAASASEDFV